MLTSHDNPQLIIVRVAGIDGVRHASALPAAAGAITRFRGDF
jgi:hypothetical protein